jgi:hypothetical protein
MKNRIISSFRDYNGFIFKEQGEIFRRVEKSYESNLNQLVSSGLYAELVKRKWIVTHEIVKEKWEEGYIIIKPQQLSLITYPYSWSFSMLKDAALLTLNLQLLALKHGMILYSIHW